MHFWRLIFAFLVVCLLLRTNHSIQAAGNLIIKSPISGSTVQGVVPVISTTQADAFQSAEVAYANESGSAAWILVNTTERPVTSARLADWNTTTIPDGSHQLRLRVIMKDGKSQETIVKGISVRNYTPGNNAQQSAVLALSALLPTPTVQPQNPATINQANLQLSMAQGAVLTLILFIVLGLYIGIRNFIHR